MNPAMQKQAAQAQALRGGGQGIIPVPNPALQGAQGPQGPAGPAGANPPADPAMGQQPQMRPVSPQMKAQLLQGGAPR